jgi:outer membrane protein TolC
VLAARTLDVLERAVARSEQLVGRATALVTGGRGAKADVLQARVDLANDQLAAESQRLQLAQTRSALATALGRAGDAALDPIAPPELDAPAAGDEGPPLEVLVERARAARPELRTQAALVEAASRAVEVARSSYWPTVSAVGSYSRSGPALRETAGVYDDPRRDYAAEGQLVVAWNLFAGRETSAGVRRAQASLAGAIAVAARADHAVTKEVTDAHAAVRTLARQITVAASTVEAARQGLEVARERADAGRATQLEVRDASLKLTNAELAVARVRIEHAIAVADLARATGTTR